MSEQDSLSGAMNRMQHEKVIILGSGLTGAEMVERFQKQAERFGARSEFDYVSEVEFRDGPPFTVKTQSGKTYTADAVIVTVGASPRKLGVPGEAEFVGRGVSYCATCDGFFFRDKDVVVVGGGDSALEEGLFLTKFATSVQIIHRRDQLRAGEILKNRAAKNEKISYLWNTVVEEIGGKGKVEKVLLKDTQTGQTREMATDGVFIFIGHDPNSSLFEGQLDMSGAGYLTVNGRMMTNVPGVFAAGEIMDPVYRQVATSVGQGTASHWLETARARSANPMTTMCSARRGQPLAK